MNLRAVDLPLPVMLALRDGEAAKAESLIGLPIPPEFAAQTVAELGGLSAANFTCCIWEGLEQTLKNIADWKHRIAAHSDLLTQIYRVEDIDRARAEGRIGVVLGWQNSTGFGDYLPNVKLFAELGILKEA